jgi:hypothetical protein
MESKFHQHQKQETIQSWSHYKKACAKKTSESNIVHLLILLSGAEGGVMYDIKKLQLTKRIYMLPHNFRKRKQKFYAAGADDWQI